MKIRWIFNALAAMEAVLCPALCLMYAFCGLALWTQTVYFCPLLGAVLAALLFSRDKRRFIWKCAGSLCLFAAALFVLRKWNVNPTFIIFGAGAVGAVLYGLI